MAGGGVGTIVAFQVVIDGIRDAGTWESWSGGGLQARHLAQDVPALGRIPGNVKPGEITLKRGTSENKVLHDWTTQVISGQRSLRDLKVIELAQFDDGSVRPVRTYSFKQAWPSKYSHATLSKYPSGPAYESVTVRFSSVEIS